MGLLRARVVDGTGVARLVPLAQGLALGPALGQASSAAAVLVDHPHAVAVVVAVVAVADVAVAAVVGAAALMTSIGTCVGKSSRCSGFECLGLDNSI